MKIEAQTLWEEFRQTGDVEIRNRLVEKYLYIVRYVSDRLQQKLPRSIPPEDSSVPWRTSTTAAVRASRPTAPRA
ncbi:MAG: hypothetical protein ACYSX0_12460 [Planctomycetota bacterium]|jgi:DNA-directed RNA polymerase specialized sigma subunit